MSNWSKWEAAKPDCFTDNNFIASVPDDFIPVKVDPNRRRSSLLASMMNPQRYEEGGGERQRGGGGETGVGEGSASTKGKTLVNVRTKMNVKIIKEFLFFSLKYRQLSINITEAPPAPRTAPRRVPAASPSFCLPPTLSPSRPCPPPKPESRVLSARQIQST